MKKIETEYYNKKIEMQKTNNKSTLNLSKLIPNILASSSTCSSDSLPPETQ